MQRRMIAILLICLLLCGVFACGGTVEPDKPSEPEPTAEAQATPEPTEAPAEPEPTAAEDEYFLPHEDGKKQLTIYWTADHINFETSAMWIWFQDSDGRGYPMYPCAYGAKCMVNVPLDVEEVGFIVRINCSEPCGTSWGEATKDFDGDRFAKMGEGDTAVYLKSGDGEIYFSEDGGVTLMQKKAVNYIGIVSLNEIKYNITPAVRLTSLDQVAVYDGDRRLEVESLSSLDNEVVAGVIKLKENLDITKLYDVEIEGYERKTAIPTGIFDSEAFVEEYTYDGDDLGAIPDGENTTFKLWAPTARDRKSTRLNSSHNA